MPKIKVNLNIPDDNHGGHLTPGVKTEDGLIFETTLVSFEYRGSRLVSGVPIKEMAIDIVASDNHIAISDEEDVNNEDLTVVVRDTFLVNYKTQIEEKEQNLKDQLQKVFDDAWAHLSVNPRIKSWWDTENFRLLYDNEDHGDDRFFHSMELQGFMTHPSHLYCDPILTWNDAGTSYLIDLTDE